MWSVCCGVMLLIDTDPLYAIAFEEPNDFRPSRRPKPDNVSYLEVIVNMRDGSAQVRKFSTVNRAVDFLEQMQYEAC